MGFVGRTAIHPSQVPVIAAAFAPDRRARWRGPTRCSAPPAGGGVSTLASGEMVDPAMRGRAESILELRRATTVLGGDP